MKCCGLYIKEGIPVPTAEKLMRARYTAYALGEIDFVMDTHDPETREEISREVTEAWSKDSDWLGLEILSIRKGGEKDDEGTVEFKAHYKSEQEGARHTHHEMALFIRRDESWYFTDGNRVTKPVVRDTPKVGRNDLCPCGSGKKFKKCCG